VWSKTIELFSKIQIDSQTNVNLWIQQQSVCKVLSNCIPIVTEKVAAILSFPNLDKGTTGNHTCSKFTPASLNVLAIFCVWENVPISYQLQVIRHLPYTLLDIIPVCSFTISLLACPPMDSNCWCPPSCHPWNQVVCTITAFKVAHSNLIAQGKDQKYILIKATDGF
jgi:hypothetical protein